MGLAGRLVILLPLALSVVGVILSALCLFAGHNEGFMEDYAIARLNTSMVGHDVIDFGGDDNAEAEEQEEDDDDGFFDDLTDSVKGKWDDVKETVEDKLNDITGNLADELAESIGISEWYSVHIMSACEGNWSPNATASSPSLNVTNCTSSTPTYRLNLDKLLDHDLSVGPFELNLADINWPEEIQEKLDIINDVLLGLFIVYVLGMAFSGLGVLGCAAAFILEGRKSVTLLNMVFASLAAACSTIGAIIITVAVTKGIKELNDVAEEAGVTAKRGTKFLAINWVAAGVMIFAALFWAVKFCSLWRKRKTHRHSHTKETY